MRGGVIWTVLLPLTIQLLAPCLCLGDPSSQAQVNSCDFTPHASNTRKHLLESTDSRILCSWLHVRVQSAISSLTLLTFPTSLFLL